MELQKYCNDCHKILPPETIECPTCKKKPQHVVCPDCSRIWEAKEYECKVCGCPIANYSKLRVIPCSKCGRPMAYDAPVCFGCGYRFYDCEDNDLNRDSFSNSDPTVHVIKCLSCGRRVTDKEEFCYKCGHHFKRKRLFYVATTIVAVCLAMMLSGYSMNTKHSLFFIFWGGMLLLIYAFFHGYKPLRTPPKGNNPSPYIKK